MINAGKYLIKIISSVINETDIDYIDKDINFKKIIKLAKFHSVESLIYQGIINNKIEIEEELLKDLEKINLKNIYKEITQSAESVLIANTLEENKIKYIFLKGFIIKNMYPQVHLRSMADIDILIEDGKLEELTNIMKSINYTVEHKGGNHDVYYKQPFMNVEMHRAMIDESYMYSKYYEGIWDRLIKSNTSKYGYNLSDEEYYIYMMVHTAKHFGIGGTGIRSIVDEWIYLKNKGDTLDFDYINNEFSKLNLTKFASNIKDLANIWFGNKVSNETFDLITEYIITSGTYGITSNSLIVREFIDEGNNKGLKCKKVKVMFARVFPSFKLMKRIYPVLNKLPILLPFLWIIRLFKIVLFRRKRIKEVYKDINEVDSKKIDKVKEVHEKSGL